MMINPQAADIAKSVQERLRGMNHGSSMHVDVKSVRSADDAATWWLVPVIFVEDPFHYHEQLAVFNEIESFLLSNKNLDVLIVPVAKPMPRGLNEH